MFQCRMINWLGDEMDACVCVFCLFLRRHSRHKPVAFIAFASNGKRFQYNFYDAVHLQHEHERVFDIYNSNDRLSKCSRTKASNASNFFSFLVRIAVYIEKCLHVEMLWPCIRVRVHAIHFSFPPFIISLWKCELITASWKERKKKTEILLFIFSMAKMRFFRSLCGFRKLRFYFFSSFVCCTNAINEFFIINVFCLQKLLFDRVTYIHITTDWTNGSLINIEIGTKKKPIAFLHQSNGEKKN